MLELKGALVAFGNKHNDDGSLLGTNHGAEVVDLLRSRLFWHMAEAMSRMLRPIVIEIGLVERRGSGLADVCASFGRLYAYFLQLKKETASVSPNGSAATLAPLFAVAADPSVSSVTHQLCTSVLRHLQWRLDKYYEAPLLVLAHVLDPVRHTSGLQVGPRSYTRSAQLVPMFLGLASRFGLPRSSAATAEHDACATVQAFMAYLVGGPQSVMSSNMGSGLGTTGRVCAVLSWRLCPTFAGTVLAEVACRLLSMPAHAAELERVWSGMGLANTPTRSRLDTGRLTKMTKIALRMRAEVAAAATTRLTVVPGSRMQRDAGGADERGAPVAAESGPGLAFADASDDTDGTADVGSVMDAGFALDTAAKELQEELDAERALCGGLDEDPPAGEDADEGAADPTESLTAVDLISACQRFVEQAVSVAGRGEQTGSTGGRARDGGTPHGGSAGSGGGTAAAPVAGQGPAHASAATVDARALLSRVFDAEWYLADAKRVYGLRREEGQ